MLTLDMMLSQLQMLYNERQEDTISYYLLIII